MKELTINSGEKGYKVYIDSTMDKFYNLLEESKIKIKDKIFLITDDVVYNLYRKEIECFAEKTKCQVYYFNNGEANKNISTVQEIYKFLLENDANRNSTLIALGGGVVGDLVGFAASTYMRGIKFVNVPTTLLSQVDSSVGGKVGYDYMGVKNLVGNFYNPVFVYVCAGFLKTLKDKQFKDGLGEVVKYGVIKDAHLFEFLNANYKYILEKENDKLLYIVKECLKIKGEVIQLDFRDEGIRNILNFGHTVGHAIEMCSEFSISHGEAVALGMLVAIKLSEKKFSIQFDLYEKVEGLLNGLGLPTKYKVDNYTTFLYAINHDKKNSDKIRFVLLEQFGKYKIKIEVTPQEVCEAIKESISRR